MNKYLKAQSWCLDNNIKIYIVPIQFKKECFIEIFNNGSLIRSPKKYNDQSEASSKIGDLYIYLYNQKKQNEGKN